MGYLASSIFIGGCAILGVLEIGGSALLYEVSQLDCQDQLGHLGVGLVVQVCAEIVTFPCDHQVCAHLSTS